MFGPKGKSQFKKGTKKGIGDSDLGYMLDNLRNLYGDDLKKAYTGVREFYRRANSKDNVAKLNLYLENLRQANKAISSIFLGNADNKTITQAFSAIGVVEGNVESILDTASTDKVLSGFLNKLESKDLNFYNFKGAHESFREVLKKGDIGSENVVDKLKEASPEAFGLGGHMLEQAALGILGPAAIPLGFLGKMAMGAVKRTKAKSLAKEKGRFDRMSLGGAQADAMVKERWKENGNKLGDSFHGSFGGVGGESPARPSSAPESSRRRGRPKDTVGEKARKVFGKKLIEGETSSGGSTSGESSKSGYLADMIKFWDKEAIKTKYLKAMAKKLGLGKGSGVAKKSFSLGGKAGKAGLIAGAAGLLTMGYVMNKKKIDKAVKNFFGKVSASWENMVSGMQGVFSKVTGVGKTIAKTATKIVSKVIAIDKMIISGMWSSVKAVGGIVNKMFFGLPKKLLNIIKKVLPKWAQGKDSKSTPKEVNSSRKSTVVVGSKEYKSNVEFRAKSMELAGQQDSLMATALSRSNRGSQQQQRSFVPSIALPSSSDGNKTMYREDDPFIDAFNAGDMGN